MDFVEFVSLMARKLQEIDTDAEIIEAYRVFDKNDDGFIPQLELRNVLVFIKETMKDTIKHKELDHEEEIDEIIRYMDQDNDGFIDFEEFFSIMTLH